MTQGKPETDFDPFPASDKLPDSSKLAGEDESASEPGEGFVVVDDPGNAARSKESASPQDLERDDFEFYLGVFDDHLWRVPLEEGTFVIGRSQSNQISLRDTLLSRKHCTLTVENGEVWLADLNSSNGTFINGERIGTRRLQIDDLIELGSTVMVLFDGESWKRGQGLLNLRNPVKAQSLVQRLGEDQVRHYSPPMSRPTTEGIRSQKGLKQDERAFLTWLKSNRETLPELIADYLTHKLVSLLIRNQPEFRTVFTQAFERALDPELFEGAESGTVVSGRVADIVRDELAKIDFSRAAELSDRDIASGGTGSSLRAALGSEEMTFLHDSGVVDDLANEDDEL